MRKQKFYISVVSSVTQKSLWPQPFTNPLFYYIWMYCLTFKFMNIYITFIASLWRHGKPLMICLMKWPFFCDCKSSRNYCFGVKKETNWEGYEFANRIKGWDFSYLVKVCGTISGIYVSSIRHSRWWIAIWNLNDGKQCDK